MPLEKQMMGSHFFGKSKIVLLGSERRRRRRRRSRRKKWHFFPPLLFGEGKRGEEEKYTPPLILLHRFSPRVSIVLFVFFFLAHREMAFLLYLRTLARGSKEEFPKRTIAPGKKQKHLVLESHKKKSGGGGKDMRQEMGQ